jgi:hypothetical protein
MATKKEVNEVVNTQVANTVSKDAFVQLAASTNPDNHVDMERLFDAAALVPVKEMTKVAGDAYLEFEAGEMIILLCMGIAKDAMPSKKEVGTMVDAVSFRNRENNELINADAVMVSTVKRLQEQGRTFPMFMNIYCKGEKKSAKGTYKDLEIRVI